MESSTWGGYFEAQRQPWFIQAMYWRMVLGVMMTAGVLLMFWDFLTIGRKEARAAKAVPTPDVYEPGRVEGTAAA